MGLSATVRVLVCKVVNSINSKQFCLFQTGTANYVLDMLLQRRP